jgi:hypothetical protein
MNTRTFGKLLPVLVVAFTTACAKDKTLESVDIAAENKPPLEVSVAGTGVTLPAGIGVAMLMTPHVDGEVAKGQLTVYCTENCAVEEGREVNEFFVVGLKPGSGKLSVGYTGAGWIDVPVTCTAQP